MDFLQIYGVIYAVVAVLHAIAIAAIWRRFVDVSRLLGDVSGRRDLTDWIADHPSTVALMIGVTWPVIWAWAMAEGVER